MPIMSKWDKYSRLSLDAAATATSTGFAAAKAGTKLGFAITRGIAASAAGLTGAAVDHALFGGAIGAGPLCGGAVSTAISAIEALTLAPIIIGESLASTALVAAQSSLSIMQTIFPGSDEASFSLVSFVTLVRREWNEDMQDGASPENRYGVTEVMKALVAWAALQGVTSDWQEQRWLKHVKEIHVNGTQSQSLPASIQQPSRIQVTGDVVYPSRGGQIVTADIGEASPSTTQALNSAFQESDSDITRDLALKATLRRFSKLVLAGYGGASLLFFGVPRIPVPSMLSSKNETVDEETRISTAINYSELEASGSSFTQDPAGPHEAPPEPGSPSFSWWNVLQGKHDKDILIRYAQAQPHLPTELPSSVKPPDVDTLMGSEVRLMPRFWVLTDHRRKEVVLVIRGTMSLNELAVDLTCDPVDFEISHTTTPRDHEQEELDAFDEQLESIPGSFPMDLSTPSSPTSRAHKRHNSIGSMASENSDVYQVHGGMLKMAKAMGARGKPVYGAVKRALRANDGYNLVICGHSLGAGVAALLALLWADPHTCLTTRISGLPTRRQVVAYCYGPPCLMSARLSRLASGLITSFVYSHDIVSRLSLGAVRDLRRAAAWLCEAEKQKGGDGYGGVTGRVLKYKAGFGRDEDPQWFLAIRKTLEANMQMAELFPPGRVLWGLREADLAPAQRLASTSNSNGSTEKLRLFEVQDVEQVFSQIIFAKDMLSSHMPHQYDRVLHELL